MKSPWCSIFAVILAGLLLVTANAPSDAARRSARGSSYDGTRSVAIYTLRGDCGSVCAALRIVGGRVYSEDSSYQAYGAVGAGGLRWQPAGEVEIGAAGDEQTASVPVAPKAALAAWRR
jgi:hypothetical protein